MAVRGKFTVQEHRKPWPGALKESEVVLRATYDPAEPEDQKYSEATPSGEIVMDISNPAALEQFPVGQAFYVDFTPAE